MDLIHVEVHRDLRMSNLAGRLVFKVPIIWMTGKYRLSNAKMFSFIPAGGDGNFNIDLKDVTIEVVATIKSTNESMTDPQYEISNASNSTNDNETFFVQQEARRQPNLICLDVFDIRMKWKGTAVKLDGMWKGFNHLADFSLNQVII